jgi:hypothetical protein
VREVEFRAYLSEEQFRRLRQNKPSAGLVTAALAVTLAWTFSAISLGPATLKFGSRPVGSSSILPVKLTNRGLTEFHATSIVVDGDSEDFRLNAQTCATVSSGESCVVWVEFRPQEPGEKLARLVVHTKDGGELSSDFAGTAEKGTGVLTPTGPRPDPIRKPVLPDRPADRSGTIATPAPPAPSPTPAVDQPGSATLPEPPPQPVQPAFPPRSAVPPPTVVPHLPTVPAPPIIPTSGTNHEPAAWPNIEIEPRAIDFSRQSGLRQRLIVVNSGTAALHMAFNLVGNDHDSFAYDANACGAVLAAHQRCSVIVTYRAGLDSQERPLLARLNVIHNARNAANPEAVALRWEQTGPPQRPHVTVSPDTIRFNSPSPASEFFSPLTQTVQVRSDGTAGLKQLNLRIDFGGGPFRYSANCPTTLEPGQGCAAQVNFAARDGRPYTGRLSVFEGSQLLASVALQAIGYQPPPPTDTGGNGLRGPAQPQPGKTAVGPAGSMTSDGVPNWTRTGGVGAGGPSRANPSLPGNVVKGAQPRANPSLYSPTGEPARRNSLQHSNVGTDTSRRSTQPQFNGTAAAEPRRRNPRPPPPPPPERPR